jgi:hypothetical protein
MSLDLTSGIDPSREAVLADQPDDPLLREAVNMWIWDEEGRFGLPRVAVEAIGRRWQERAVQANVAFPDGRVLLGTCVGHARPARTGTGVPAVLGAGPLSFECLEPFRRWRASFHGPALDTTVAEQAAGAPGARPAVRLDVEVEATMAVPAWFPGQFSPQAQDVLTGGPEGGFISTRYEQLFRAEGTFAVDGEPVAFRGGGLRIRRQGRRDTSELWGHTWQAALFPSGRAFAYNCFPPRPNGAPSYNEGYVFDGGRMVSATAVEVPWMTRFEPTGGDVSCTLRTESGVVQIEARTALSTCILKVSVLNDLFAMPFLGGDDRLYFHQGIARYRWDGEEAYGMIERSFPVDRIAPLA